MPSVTNDRTLAPPEALLLWLRRITAVCAGGAMLLGLLGLIGRFAGQPFLTHFLRGTTPMAPSVALQLLLLGVFLFLREHTRRWRFLPTLVLPVLPLIVLFGLLEGLETFFRQWSPAFPERFVFPHLITADALASPVAGWLLLLCGAGLIFLFLPPRQTPFWQQLAGSLGSLAMVFSGIFFVSYLYGTPLLYGSAVIPLAFPTSLAFLLLGTGIAAAAGPDAMPVRWFIGPATRGRLLRVFFPLAVLLLFAADLVQIRLAVLFGQYGALVSACAAIGISTIALLLILLFSRLVGNDIDQAHAQRLQAKQALSEERNRLLVTLKSIGDGVIVTDTAGRMVLLNSVAETLTGWTQAEALGRSIDDIFVIINETTHAPVPSPIAQVLESGMVVGLANHTVLIARDGAERNIADSGAPIRDEDDRIIGVVLVFRDVTEDRTTERNLRRSEARFRQLFTTMAEGVALHEIICDATGRPSDYRFLEINPAFETLTGISAEQALGRTAREVIPALEQEWIERYGQVALTGEPLHFAQSSGSLNRDYEVTAYSPQHGQFAAIFLDVTERRRAEEQLLQAAKMESIGRLAGGVAHDFNNILTGIIGFTELSLAQLGSNTSGQANLHEVLSLADRAANLTRQLLAFSRQQPFQPQQIRLNPVIEHAVKMLQRLIGEDINLRYLPTAEQDTLFADPGQLEQLLMNLAVNARDAMPTGGSLIIETATVLLDDGYVATHLAAKPGAFVRLTVTDNGHGIPAEALPHIFEPFFTTKEIGKGTGLGLATVYGIVKQHGGSIWVYSELTQGTTFKIYLPLQYSASTQCLVTQQPSPIQRGQETILLVEDEEAVRNVTRCILEAHGYTVIEAAQPADAEVRFREHHADIALLLTDVIMPGFSGVELAHRLHRKHPALRVLYLSGYSGEALAQNSELYEAAHVVQKPYKADDLLRRIRQMLDA
ncbi:MAG TPA: PAS domain S-box protein [Armatimonadota bacterium]